MSTVLEPNKTKIAKRVIEVFEFFDENCQRATVMDIVRRYGRPQSSTSELLSSLVDMGLLYKDPRSRFYSPTPRLAALGASTQPDFIRDGGLFTFMDRLAHTTQSSVALFGMIGTFVQIFRFAPGDEPATRSIGCGASEPLSASAAGLLLLATLPPEQAGRLLWRLHAEATEQTKFNPVEIREQIALYRRQGYGVGKSGFLPGMQVTATLLPRSGSERPLALGVFSTGVTTIKSDDLIEMMKQGLSQFCTGRNQKDTQPPLPTPYMMAV